MAYVNQHYELFMAYKRAHPELRPQQAQFNTNIIWKDAKKEFKRKKPEFTRYIQGIIDELQHHTESREAGYILPQIPYVPPLPQESAKPQLPVNTPVSYAAQPMQISPGELSTKVCVGKRERSLSPVTLSDEETETERRKYNTPAQDSLRNHIALLESELNSATLTRNSGLGGPEIDTKIEQLSRSLDEEKRKLAKIVECAKRQKTFRVRRKDTFTQLLAYNSDVAELAKIGAVPVTPLHEITPSEIVRVVLEIARFGGFIDLHRSQELALKCRTVEQVDMELRSYGLRFGKCGNYWRLLPIGSSPEHGLRYETTVPVRLCHMDNDKDHVDHKFCASTINSLECVASILGSQQVAMVSHDGRARMPLAITAAAKDAPILMRMEYHDSPDQDFISPSRHKLQVSAYAGITVQDELMGAPEAVGFSGPTYLAVRAEKQASNPTGNFVLDFERIAWLPAFRDVLKVDGKTKPVLMMTSYGRPDHSPRYPKNIQQAVRIFKEHQLDALYLSTCVFGKTISNKVERRLAPLSREMFGIILPHDPFGSHLNDSGVIIDEELEVRNVEYVAKVLCETWSRFVIDNHPVVAEYVAHKAEDSVDFKSSEWYSIHVRESQYFLQIVKCGYIGCCAPMRSNLKNVLPTGFFPAPYPIKRTSTGLEIPNPHEITGEDDLSPLLVRQMVNIKPANSVGLELPYDQYCPSVQSQILGRTCQMCGVYFASKKSVLLHTRDVHKMMGGPATKVRPRMILAHRKKEILCLIEDCVTGAQAAEWLNEEDVDLVGLSIPEQPSANVIPIIGDKLSNWVQFPWLPDA